ncbi:MAG TPA: 5'/3'-nucleotidase SurE [Spirochaetia bacterium]|nr:5'/3'-nucleotidase SurE [Spirochaetia bacterium]
MRILLTNDDGIQSAGLTILRDYLSSEHEVWIVAPDGERSGMSHSLTLKEPVRSRKIDDRSFATSGTPADCVILALVGIMPARPDIVLSGINIGPNLGTDLVYSGTAAAARQASLMGIPAIALSLDGFVAPLHFEPLTEFVASNIDMLSDLWERHHFININAPNRPERRPAVEITKPSRRIYHDTLVSAESPKGDTYYFLDGTPPNVEPENGTDWDAVHRGSISVSPIYLHPLNHFEDDRYQDAALLWSARGEAKERHRV